MKHQNESQIYNRRKEEIKWLKEKAEKRFIELIKTNKHVKDRKVDLEKHYKDIEENCRANIGAYRLEQHEIIE